MEQLGRIGTIPERIFQTHSLQKYPFRMGLTRATVPSCHQSRRTVWPGHPARSQTNSKISRSLIPESNFSSVSWWPTSVESERYKDFLITSSAVPTFATDFGWNAQGIIFRPGRLSSIVEVKRIKGPIFNNKEEAEQHGLELCKDWIDRQP